MMMVKNGLFIMIDLEYRGILHTPEICRNMKLIIGITEVGLGNMIPVKKLVKKEIIHRIFHRKMESLP